MGYLSWVVHLSLWDHCKRSRCKMSYIYKYLTKYLLNFANVIQSNQRLLRYNIFAFKSGTIIELNTRSFGLVPSTVLTSYLNNVKASINLISLIAKNLPGLSSDLISQEEQG